MLTTIRLDTARKAEKIVSETTGWVIVHPDGRVETDYFSEPRRMSDESLEKYRPGCVRVKVQLIPIEDD